MKTENVLTLDIHVAAYLSLHGIPPIFTKKGSRIIFEFPSSPEVEELIRRYNGNPHVKVLDYVHHLRKTRSIMLASR